MGFPPTSEQQEIMDAGRAGYNLLIKALAGTGKTTTLELLSSVLPVKPTLALAFNVKNKKDLEKKFPAHFDVKTINGLGHTAFGSAIGKRLILEEGKIGKLITSHFKEIEWKGPQEDWMIVKQLITGARNVGIVPKKLQQNFPGLRPDTAEEWLQLDVEGDVEQQHIEMAQHLLMESIKMSFAGTIDYDDQIYMSVLFNGRFPRYPIVMVDEAQDLSVMNHTMVQRCAADKLIIVGDPHQAIYAFRGADSSSMMKLKKLRSEWKELNLSVTWRCAKKIVARQQNHVPGFKAADTNVEGTVTQLGPKGQEPREGEPTSWNWDSVNRIAQGGSIAILCRNNAPILGMAFKLLRQNISVMVLGRDIGRSLIATAKKVTSDLTTPIEAFLKLLDAWKSNEIYKADQLGQESKKERITDQCECLVAVAEASKAKTLLDLSNALTELFSKDSGRIVLSTGHRSKGLEWDTVIHLDPYRLPSSFARKAYSEGNAIPMEQDMNLLYVIETRTKKNLILARLEHFESQ